MILVAVRVELRLHTLSDEIGGKVSNVTIIKLDSVNASIQNGVVVGSTDGGTIHGVLARDNSTTLHVLAERKEQFSQDLIVSDIRGRWLDFFEVWVIVGRVIIIVSEVRGQI